MKRGIHTFLILFIALAFACSQSHKPNQKSEIKEVTSEDIYTFLTSEHLTKNDTLLLHEDVKGIDSSLVKNIPDSFLTLRDKEYMISQLVHNKIRKWDKIKLGHNYIILTEDSLNKMYKSKRRIINGTIWTNSYDYIDYSLPLFSIDKEQVLIEINDYCSGLLCGSGYIILYKKENGIWIKEYSRMLWVS
jgi:hypothetical protein